MRPSAPGAALAILPAAGAHAQNPGKVLQASPPGQVMVVSANLKASFNNRYIRSSGGRMRILCQRLLAHIYESGGAWKPDVLLLQEALNRQFAPGDGVADDLSATRVASELTQMTGDPYAIVVDPGRRQTAEARRQQGDRDRRQPGDDAIARGRRLHRLQRLQAQAQVQAHGPATGRARAEPPPGLGRDQGARARWGHLPGRERPLSDRQAPRLHQGREVPEAGEQAEGVLDRPGQRGTALGRARLHSIGRSSAATSTRRARTGSSAASSASATTRRSAAASTTSSTAACAASAASTTRSTRAAAPTRWTTRTTASSGRRWARSGLVQ